MVHFTYNDQQLSLQLRQGDVLRRTPELDAILKYAHPHYFSRAENKYFIVLTQDCDLFRRGGKPCSARYIELAAVRRVDHVIARQLESLRDRKIAPEVLICTTQGQGRLKNFMERLLNNNEPEYFYLHREQSRGLAEDCCAFLALSIAIKADLHYDICVQAKILELADSFRAKLGWLVGRMYSPVGTEDWPEDKIEQEILAKTTALSLWIDEKQLRALHKLAQKWQEDNPGQSLTVEIISDLVNKVPKRQQQVIDRAIAVLKEHKLLSEDLEVKAANRLRSDPDLAVLLK